MPSPRQDHVPGCHEEFITSCGVVGVQENPGDDKERLPSGQRLLEVAGITRNSYSYGRVAEAYRGIAGDSGTLPPQLLREPRQFLPIWTQL